MKKQIALVEVWLGKIPDYFQYHLETISHISEVDFYFFTDDKNYDFSKIKNNNFFVNYITTNEFLNRFNKNGEVIINEIKYLKKIIDFKLSYFEMFSDYLSEYPYVGIYDIDTLFGDLNQTLRDAIGLYDFISVADEVYHNRLGGPLMIMRNSSELMSLIKTKRYYETLLSDEIYGYGEQELSEEAVKNYKVKLIYSSNIESENGGKNTYQAYWSGGKLYVNNVEKLFYHFYRKNHTKLNKTGNVITAHYDKKYVEDFLWIVHFSEKYETLLPYLMDSIKKYSNRKCVFYSINYTPSFLFKTQFESEQFIFRRIDMPPGPVDYRGRDQTIMCSKPVILMDAIDTFPNKKFVHIDTDIYLTTNADDIVKYFDRLENYPLMNSHIHDVMYVSGVRPDEEWTSPLHILLEAMGETKDPIFPRRKCNVILFNEKCRWFFKEQMELYNTYKNSTKGIFLFQDEDSANALLAKYQFKNSLPLIDIEESYNLNMDKIHNYSYNMTGTSPWVELPKNINDFLVFHGFKQTNDYEQIQKEYGNYTIENEEIVISYSNGTILFERNSFMTTKKFNSMVNFRICDLNGSILYELNNQDFFNYWIFYISDLELSGKFLIKIVESTTDRCIFNDVIEIK